MTVSICILVDDLVDDLSTWRRLICAGPRGPEIVTLITTRRVNVVVMCHTSFRVATRQAAGATLLL